MSAVPERPLVAMWARVWRVCTASQAAPPTVSLTRARTPAASFASRAWDDARRESMERIARLRRFVFMPPPTPEPRRDYAPGGNLRDGPGRRGPGRLRGWADPHRPGSDRPGLARRR